VDNVPAFITYLQAPLLMPRRRRPPDEGGANQSRCLYSFRVIDGPHGPAHPGHFLWRPLIIQSAVPLMITVLGCACASTPYAMIDGTRSSRTDASEADVMVVGIDGRLMRPRGLMNVEPGVHALYLATTRSDRRGAHTAQHFELKAEPCMRYVISAQHRNSIDREDWDLVVKSVEPIPGCPLPKETQSSEAASP